MKRIGTMTLGCKVNHTETQGIEGLFRGAGYEVVPFESDAEVYLINTCSVTHLGEKKSRQIIRRAIRNHPEATIVVTGCYAQSAPGEISGIEGQKREEQEGQHQPHVEAGSEQQDGDHVGAHADHHVRRGE